jgi:hypothetical protein
MQRVFGHSERSAPLAIFYFREPFSQEGHPTELNQRPFIADGLEIIRAIDAVAAQPIMTGHFTRGSSMSNQLSRSFCKSRLVALQHDHRISSSILDPEVATPN